MLYTTQHSDACATYLAAALAPLDHKFFFFVLSLLFRCTSLNRRSTEPAGGMTNSVFLFVVVWVIFYIARCKTTLSFVIVIFLFKQ